MICPRNKILSLGMTFTDKPLEYSAVNSSWHSSILRSLHTNQGLVLPYPCTNFTTSYSRCSLLNSH